MKRLDTVEASTAAANTYADGSGVVQGRVTSRTSIVCGCCGRRTSAFEPEDVPGRWFVDHHTRPNGKLCMMGSWSDYSPPGEASSYERGNISMVRTPLAKTDPE